MISAPEARQWIGKRGLRTRQELNHGWRVLIRLGLGSAIRWMADRWLRRVIPLRVAVVVAHEWNRCAPAHGPWPLEWRSAFLSPMEARVIATYRPDWCPAGFVDDALARGDRCFGVFEGDRLVYSCWYSVTPVPALGGTRVSVSPEYVYGYRAHTDRDRRGLGLHVYGVAAADARLAGQSGRRGVVAYIDACNDSSLLAAKKIGDELVGSVVLWRIGRSVYAFTTRGCSRVGFTIDTSDASADSPDLRRARS